VKEFRAVEHRLELVSTINGVTFYNDSKATNVDATVKALDPFPRTSTLSGRQGQRQRLHSPKPADAERVKRAYLIGAASTRLLSHLQNSTTVVRSGTLERAVHQAFDAGQTRRRLSLLAPACATLPV